MDFVEATVKAIYHLQMTVKKGYEWCASIDLAKFFDEIPHNLVLKLIRRKIADERLVTLIAETLKAGTMVEGKLEKTTKGLPSRVSALADVVKYCFERTGSGTGEKRPSVLSLADDFWFC